MTTNNPDIPPILQIPFHKLEATNDGITIIKNKALLNGRISGILMVATLTAIILWTVLRQSPNAFKKPISLTGLVTLLVITLFILITAFLKVKRLKRLISNFIIRKKDCLYINESPIQIANNERIVVAIQNVGAAGGVGGSFTVGISAGKNFYGLCYDLDKVFARKVANFISYHLNYDLEIREEASAIPLIRGH